MQEDAYDDLMVISQASGALLEDLPGYAYDSVGGQGITVYVVDSGINPAHEVSVTDYQ
jgi:subtilisin family serine protease